MNKDHNVDYYAAVFYGKAFFYDQIRKNDYYKSLINEDNLSQKNNKFFKINKEDKGDTLEFKQKINNLYEQTLQNSTEKDDLKKGEKMIKNRLTKILNKEEGCCCTAF